jgi:hypothetical protein
VRVSQPRSCLIASSTSLVRQPEQVGFQRVKYEDRRFLAWLTATITFAVLRPRGWIAPLMPAAM